MSRLSVSARLVDARGRACPLPIVDLARALKAEPLVELWADDPAAEGDLRAFCAGTGHQLLACDGGAGFLRATVARRPVPGS
jgi:tRNA 2-thiouridine synthesizing protein A